MIRQYLQLGKTFLQLIHLALASLDLPHQLLFVRFDVHQPFPHLRYTLFRRLYAFPNLGLDLKTASFEIGEANICT